MKHNFCGCKSVIKIENYNLLVSYPSLTRRKNSSNRPHFEGVMTVLFKKKKFFLQIFSLEAGSSEAAMSQALATVGLGGRIQTMLSSLVETQLQRVEMKYSLKMAALKNRFEKLSF